LQAALKDKKNMTLVQKGVSDHSGELRFNVDAGNRSSDAIDPSGSEVIEVGKIDNYTGPNMTVGLIKMDIEGAELAALKGARDTILRDKPVLAISAYHKPDDLISIPQHIKSLCPEYKLYVRYNYACPLTLYEFVIYGVHN
jgi:hypothetical protein